MASCIIKRKILQELRRMRRLMTPAEAAQIVEWERKQEVQGLEEWMRAAFGASPTVSVINTFTASKHLSFKLSTNDITHFLRTNASLGVELDKEKHRRILFFRRESGTESERVRARENNLI